MYGGGYLIFKLKTFWSGGVISRLISGFSIEITMDQDKMWITIGYIN